MCGKVRGRIVNQQQNWISILVDFNFEPDQSKTFLAQDKKKSIKYHYEWMTSFAFFMQF